MTTTLPPAAAHAALSGWLAGALVFFSSGTVLVLEILGIRLLAPYVGSSLDTYTAIIGTVLAGISLGTYLGGWLSDRLSPAKMLAPVLLISGATTLFIVPAIRFFGGLFADASAPSVILLSLVGLLIPAAVLSAVSPIVVKLQLASIDKTGTTVGRLSAIGTAGAIAGTFLTGFVLLAYFRTSVIVITIGVGLIAAGAVLAAVLRHSRSAGRAAIAAAVALVVGVPLTNAAGSLCDRESPYYCMRLVADPGNPGGQLLLLDRLSHSYVDLDDPGHLEFWYVQAMAAAVNTLKPQSPLDVLTVGGGGFTLPRYFAATRPGSEITSLEIDPALVDFNRNRLRLDSVAGLTVKTGDARATIEDLPTNGYDLVIADAFGNESVPWHLSTVEFNQAINRVANPEGLLVMNVIDFGHRELLKAELRTLQQVWPHVALIERRQGDRVVEGNFVVVASNQPLTGDDLKERLRRLGEPSFVVTGDELDRLVNDAAVLTDDFAPADQLLAESLRSNR